MIGRNHDRAEFLYILLLQNLPVLVISCWALYVDSVGTVRTGSDESSVRKSVWVRRKTDVLNDAHSHGVVDYMKVDEADNVSDGASKPIKRAVHKRHARYMSGDWPPSPTS